MQPSAPKKMRRDESLEQILNEALASADVYIDEESALTELVQTRNWYPTSNDLIALITKYSLGQKNRCLCCKVDMGQMNPRQYCGKTRCLQEE